MGMLESCPCAAGCYEDGAALLSSVQGRLVWQTTLSVDAPNDFHSVHSSHKHDALSTMGRGLCLVPQTWVECWDCVYMRFLLTGWFWSSRHFSLTVLEVGRTGRVKFWLRDISQISFGCVLIWARERKGREYGKSANSRSEIIVSKGTESI